MTNRNRKSWVGICALCLWVPYLYSADLELVSKHARPGYQLLHGRSQPAEVRWDENDYEVVKIAARGLMTDLAAVTGEEAAQGTNSGLGSRIYLGSLEQSPLIKSIVESISLDLSQLQGAWESFVIKTIADPQRPGRSALLIVGSDRRGTAYGAYELSQAMGVSPWYWWADVPAKKSESIYIHEGLHRFGPPSVKYRGIFINDEDWGLQAWARDHYEKELGNIGPKTYAKVFDLMLRLKANTLWPAMHKVSLAFNEVRENKVLADRYAIVMGSSHAEPMLRNNVKEWSLPKASYNYATHRKQVVQYWETRVRENGQFENIYSLGMRGIHDSGMRGGGSSKEKIALMESIFSDQRKLLQANVKPQLADIPQVFTPYKEVLALYRDGLKVPEEVSLIWPDDNHGYIRQLPNARERTRRGGSGVYYHLSYLGSPLAYLWLYSTPPALVWEEMHKAYALGARALWVANVGDIKPGEIGADFFLQMAWDIDRWNLANQHTFLESWSRREFGPAGKGIGELMRAYFALNFQRKPEHLQWWLPHTRSKGSNLTAAEIEARLSAFEKLDAGVQAVKKLLHEEQLDAFFQLVEYPLRASASANRRYFHSEQYSRWFHESTAMARAHGQLAIRADTELKELTRIYNEDIAGGKWNGIMSVEPADNLWRSYRQSPTILPSVAIVGKESKMEALEYRGMSYAEPEVQLEAENFSASVSPSNFSWRIVKDLGRIGDAVALFPITEGPTSLKNIKKHAPYLDYEIELPEAGDYFMSFSLLPSFPLLGNRALQLAFELPGSKSGVQRLELQRQVGNKEWKHAVLNASMRLSTEVSLKKGKQKLRVYGIDAGVILDQIFLGKTQIPDSFTLPM